MRSALVVLAAIAATVAAGSPAAAQNFRKLPDANRAAALKVDDAQASEGRATKVYVVQMAAQPAITYDGSTAGLAKTAPAKGETYDARSSQAQMYAAHLEAEQDRLLAKVGAGARKIYSYRHALNGFAARLTPSEAAKLRKDKSVLNVWEDRPLKLDTNNTPRYLGLLDEEKGLRRGLNLRGTNVIIGIIDSGAVQEHPSFDDATFGPVPARWNGICQPGEGWAETDCNNKLIGARWFADGFLAALEMEPGEFLSARDSDGHGTHTATTAAGRVVQATLNGKPLAKISGMAPRARVAVYKPCWEDLGGDQGASCFFSDSAAATDAAVADGVDILSFSVGTASAFTDPQDLAFLSAVDAGIFVSRSSGNEGPGPFTTAAGEPWNMTVGASTHRGTGFAQATRINSPPSIAGDYPSFEAVFTPPLALVGPLTADVAAANPLEACTALPASSLTGHIALIARGTCNFDLKVANASKAGAIGVILFSQAGNPKVVPGGTPTPDTQIPTVIVDNEPGVLILDRLTAGEAVNATLAADVFITEKLAPGSVMAGFSSRGPYSTVQDWIKPDVTAPGVQILAGHTPEPNVSPVGDFFQYLQGTSMSTPHVAGIAALLKQKYRKWSPAMIKSALMTTARRNLVKEDGVTPADPFDFGAGHIVPNKAIDPGLVYDAGLFDYLAASCGTATPLVSPTNCGVLESLGFSLDPSDLNLPSIGIADVLGSQTVRRTVTNVGKKYATYQVGVNRPEGFRVQVSPRTLTLSPGESATYEVRVTNVSAPAGEWRFGRVFWRDGKGHVVSSPLAVKAKTVDAPAEVNGAGAEGSTSFDVKFGYNGPYTPGAHGLVEPFLTLAEVADDPANSFDFNFGPDEPLVYLFELPTGTNYVQWSLFDQYNDKPNHDLDLYVFYCPGFSCTQVGGSFNITSNEEVGLIMPATNGVAPDPNDADDPYAVFIHGFETAGGAVAQTIMFDWTVLGPEGNMTVSGPANATIGGMGTVNLQWTGLLTGPGEKQVGAVSHSSATGIQGLTIVNIENDAGLGFCDFGLCP